MAESVLDRIVADRRSALAAMKKERPEATFIRDTKPSDRDFQDALRARSPAYILECKKASPSKGLIREDFDLDTVARVYGQWANVISVLTDTKYFQGRMNDLMQVRKHVTQPVLCKDFIVDAYQIRVARYHGADAVLLMLSVLDDEEYGKLAAVAHDYNMGVLTEISNEAELKRAVELGAGVIGINNRNLRDLSIDLERSKQLAPRIPDDRIVISESGIHNHAQVRDLGRYVDGFLVGSSLVSHRNTHRAVADLLLGTNKVCGLTRETDAASAYWEGVRYGGLIFAQRSPRYVDLERARALVDSAPLDWVGVFVNDAPGRIADYARKLRLSAVQLHGQESPQYVRELKAKLPASVQVWKAHAINDRLPDFSPWDVDRHLLDTHAGRRSEGTGQTFDWGILHQRDLSRVILAGGLNAGNASSAARLGCASLDFNSGLEAAPGIKSPAAIRDVMQCLRTF